MSGAIAIHQTRNPVVKVAASTQQQSSSAGLCA
jgi:hypothetical protein